MNILIIGNGGREHALALKISESSLLNKLYVAPGNYGTSLIASNVDLKVDDVQGIIDFVLTNKIDLVVVGPEVALISGISDELSKLNVKVLGPTKKAAQIESSKEYAKMIMNKNQIACADYVKFNDYDKAKAYLLNKNTYPTVIKYDGLAAGKGVYIPKNEQESLEVLKDILIDKSLGNDGLIIEDFLEGDEFTLLALVNQDKVYPFQSARDFKRIYDNDLGLNTGGMGAICPYHNVSKQDYDKALEILNKCAQGLLKENNPFSGILYGGFIKTKDGIKVIEFNARFGDPETQVVLNNLDSDLLENILELLDDKPVVLKFKDQVSVGLVLSAFGYPNEYEKHVDLTVYLNLDLSFIHMATSKVDTCIVSNGGRVLFALNQADNAKEGYNKIYQELNKVQEHKLHYRKDLENY